MATARDRVLAAARQDIGYRERADGRTKHGEWYVRNKPAPEVFASAAWCQMAQGFWANAAGVPEDAFPRLAYTPYAVQWFKDRNRWGTKPRAGALVYFNFPGGDFVDHVEIVEAVRADGSIVTIGGNVGNRVQRLVRRYNIAGYGYPNYGAAEKDSTEVMVDKLPLLKPGAKGKHVKTAFYLLKARGYGKDLDEKVIDPTVYSPQIVTEVKRMQGDKGITRDGEIGAGETWPALLGV